MRQTIRSLTLLTLGLVLGLFLAGAAGAEGPRKEFLGLIQKVSKKELMVDNRMGDKLKFKPAGDVAVSGSGQNASSANFVLGVGGRKDFEILVRVIGAPKSTLVKTIADVNRASDDAELASESESTTLQK